jgi:hypothetical protein
MFVSPPEGTGILNVTADKGTEVRVSKADKNGYIVTVKKPGAEVGK